MNKKYDNHSNKSSNEEIKKNNKKNLFRNFKYIEKNNKKSVTKSFVFKNKNKKQKKTNLVANLSNNSKNIYSKNHVSNKFIKKSNFIIKNRNKLVKTNNKNILIKKNISILELANKINIKVSELISIVINLGFEVTVNQIVNTEVIQAIAKHTGHTIIFNNKKNKKLTPLDNNYEIKETRAPIVTVMGHVDHGKTSLLDFIRSTKVAVNENGGITQHIGAYHIKFNNNMITFLDTPGHAAFSNMRSRGVKITDIVVLVVAADDGVMPQTIEAIQHAKKANVPIIIAINKIDKLEKNIIKIKNELSQYHLIPEEWGGENQYIEISAKLGIGIDNLLNSILLQAEMLELKTIHKGIASGTVIESSLNTGKGPIATILIQKGLLKLGDTILCGCEYGNVRAIYNENGINIKFAGPSTPVEIIGLSGIPQVGDLFITMNNEKEAKKIALNRQNQFHINNLINEPKKIINIFNNVKKNETVNFKIILKSDVQGSNEAILNILKTLSTEKIKVEIIYYGVGNITETDISLALSSNAIILGFNVNIDISLRKNIILKYSNIYLYSIIYNLIDEIKQLISNITSPKYQQNIIGSAEIRHTFNSPKLGVIAGCMIIRGIAKRNSDIRILRQNIIIHEGIIASIRHFKNDTNEVRSGMECGISIKNFNEIQIGDIIEIIENIKI